MHEVNLFPGRGSYPAEIRFKISARLCNDPETMAGIEELVHLTDYLTEKLQEAEYYMSDQLHADFKGGGVYEVELLWRRGPETQPCKDCGEEVAINPWHEGPVWCLECYNAHLGGETPE